MRIPRPACWWLRRPFFLLVTLFTAALATARDKPENWTEVQSPHFSVVSNSNEKQARRIADQFERMRSVFHALFPRLQTDTGAPIIVLAIKGEKDFRALEPTAYLARDNSSWAGCFCAGRKRTTFCCGSTPRASILMPRCITNTRICF